MAPRQNRYNPVTANNHDSGHAIPPGTIRYRSSSDPHSPLGAVGSTSGPAKTPSAASSGANNYNRMTLEALMNAPSRKLQPHLHPRKLNGALYPSIHKFIQTTWKTYYMGPWSNWKFVHDERKEKWWQTFVQNYYWEDQFQAKSTVVFGKPSRKRSKSAASSHMTRHGEKWIHKHCAGPQIFLKIEYDMMVEPALHEPPPYTDLVRKTHTRSDRSSVDGRSETLVLEVEEAVAEMTADDGSSNSYSQDTPTTATSAAPTHILLNQEFLKLRDFTPTKSVHASHRHPIDMVMHISGLEANSKAVNSKVETLKEDVVAMRGAIKEELATVKNEMVAVLNAFIQKVGTTPLSTTTVDASLPVTAAAASTNPAKTTNPTQEHSTLEHLCAVRRLVFESDS
ncbi:unnamed protein product [Thlaspi arvense]|uniref:Uncharacterized protein n=1 Tax=Thlaspi arvense TaxID=13288 RepID=A0AAU9SWA8_THLAR|nr:unnamed protein product [Thlaspi arvense]